MKIGFIGLGSMGAHMARNLLHAGFDVTVYDVRADAANEHIALGATLAEMPPSARQRSTCWSPCCPIRARWSW